RGSIVEGKCSSSLEASSKLRWISARSAGSSGTGAGRFLAANNRRKIIFNQQIAGMSAEAAGSSARATSALKRALRMGQENGQAHFAVIGRAVALGAVHAVDIHLARAQLRIGNRHRSVASLTDRCHQ